MTITPALSRACAERLLHAALTNQGDPLGYHAFGGPQQGDDEDAEEVFESDQVDFLAELATDALGGGQPGVLERVVRTTCHDRMDPATAALLAHMGVVPAVALVLRGAALAQNAALDIVDAGDEDETSRILAHVESWEIDLGITGAHWSSEGALTVGPIPDAVAVAATGRPLRDVVSHPALDMLDLTVDRIDTGPERSIVWLAGFAQDAMATLGVRDLEDMRRATLRRAA